MEGGVGATRLAASAAGAAKSPSCASEASTTTAALGMIEDVAKSKVPALGYTVTYAVGNTLLTIWGLVIVLLMS